MLQESSFQKGKLKYSEFLFDAKLQPRSNNLFSALPLWSRSSAMSVEN